MSDHLITEIAHVKKKAQAITLKVSLMMKDVWSGLRCVNNSSYLCVSCWKK